MKNYGYIPPYIKKEHWVLGGLNDLPKEVLQLDGQWDDFLPVYEPQADKYETYACTVYGSENQIEIYMKRKFGFEPNYDERFIYNIADINPPGADPQDVYESERKFGLIDNQSLPDSYEEFCQPRPMTKEFKDKGRQWLNQYTFKHQYLFYPMADLKYKQEKMMEILPFSPLGISVVGWKERNGLYYKETGEMDNHWCVCYGYKKGEYWKIFDSYDHSLKRLEWDYDFGTAKQIFIEEKKIKLNFWTSLSKLCYNKEL